MKKFYILFFINLITFGLVMILFSISDEAPINWIKLGVQTLAFAVVSGLFFVWFTNRSKR